MSKIVFYIDMMDRTGAQRVMLILSEYFVSKGNDVILVNDYKRTDDNQFQIDERISKVFLRDSLQGNPLIKNIQRIIKLRKLIREEKPAFVISFMGRPNIRMLLATAGVKVKKIVSVRNDPNKEYGSSRWKKKFVNTLFRLSNGIVFQTKEAASYFSRINNNKSIIIANPIRDEFFNCKRSGPTNGIVTFGRLFPQKNHRLLIDAFKNISNITNEDLYIYGEGDLLGTLEDYCREQGIENRVMFPGNVSNVAKILEQSKLFVLSSDFEGMPNALMEAMAVGLPCISTDCPCGGPKMLLSDNAGLLTEVGNVDELAEKMKSVLENESLQNSLSENARTKALQFKTDRICKQWDDYLDTL